MTENVGLSKLKVAQLQEARALADINRKMDYKRYIRMLAYICTPFEAVK